MTATDAHTASSLSEPTVNWPRGSDVKGKRGRQTGSIQCVEQHTHPGDTIEKWLIEKPVISARKFLNRFLFYKTVIFRFIYYTVLFIALTILIPVLSEYRIIYKL